MIRRFRLVSAVGAPLTMLVAASPVVAAGDGANFGAWVAHHATTDGGFSRDHNPGMHRGIASWPGCPDA